MDFDEHLLVNVFNGDRDRFEAAKALIIAEGRKDTVTWQSLIADTPDQNQTLHLESIEAYAGLAYQLENVSFSPFPRSSSGRSRLRLIQYDLPGPYDTEPIQ